MLLRAAFSFRYASVTPEFDDIQSIIAKIFESISAGKYPPTLSPNTQSARTHTVACSVMLYAQLHSLQRNIL